MRARAWLTIIVAGSLLLSGPTPPPRSQRVLNGAGPRVGSVKPGDRARPAIVIISIDTLRADHLGAWGSQGGTSPFLDSLAAGGTVFEEAVVPLPATGPSHASLLTGLLPWHHAVGVNGVAIADGVDTLPSALRRAGYYTIGAVAVTHLGAACGFDRGFDSFSEPVAAVQMNDNRRDAAAVNQSVKTAVRDYLLGHRSQPLFLWVHYFDVHYPYRWWDRSDPDRDVAWKPAQMSDRPKQLARYDDGIRHVDAAVRNIHEFLTASGLMTNAVLVVAGDHGEQIGDHGVDVGHVDLYRETVHVPLIMVGPGLPKERVAETVSTMDVAPTLARIGGATLDQRLDGVDLQAAIDRPRMSSPPRRLLTVIGTPQLTRSIELVDGKRWFIKNFDAFYRSAWIATPAPSVDRPVTRVPESERTSEHAAYRVPVREYRPFMLTLEHIAVSPACAATATVKLLDGAKYFDRPISFRGSLRVVVPVARFDSVALIIAPSSCAGETRYSIGPPGQAKVPPVRSVTTDLFTNLGAPRKNADDDELFDVARDPAMVRPIRDPTELAMRDGLLADVFRSVAISDPVNLTISPDLLQRLRALGYIR